MICTERASRFLARLVLLKRVNKTVSWKWRRPPFFSLVGVGSCGVRHERNLGTLPYLSLLFTFTVSYLTYVYHSLKPMTSAHTPPPRPFIKEYQIIPSQTSSSSMDMCTETSSSVSEVGTTIYMPYHAIPYHITYHTHTHTHTHNPTSSCCKEH